LRDDEYTDLWATVRVVQEALQRYYTQCEAFNVAVQDGLAAGQSVPHVHVHILPRVPGDYERNDDIYNDIEHWAPRDDFELKTADAKSLDVPDDADRKDRTPEDMAEEAALYRDILQK
jgi:bis(5'-adenosyl)-triphosphatase